MNRQGGRTLAFKFPFLDSKSPFIRIVRSELSGVEAQMFDTDMAIKAMEDAAVLDAPVEEVRMDLSSLSVSAKEFKQLNVEAHEFTPFGAPAQEFLSDGENLSAYVSSVIAQKMASM